MAQLTQKCSWCGSDDWERVVMRSDGVVVRRCRRCGLKSVQSVPFDPKEHYEETYFLKPGSTGIQDDGYSDYEGIPEEEFAWRTGLIDLWHSGRGRLLDVGCATGSFLALAERAGWQAEGIDISRHAVEVARSKGLDARVGTIESESLSEPDGIYDVITAFDVVEHVPDVREFVRAARRLLKPGGCFLMLSPNAGAQRPKVMGEKWLGYTSSLEHLHYLDMKFLRAALSEEFGDPRLSVAEFSRGGYDYLLGAAHRPVNRREVKPPTLRALFVNRSESFWRPGGDVLQMLETKRNLEDLGVQVDISLCEYPVGQGYNQYDLAHVFNSQIPYEAFQQARHLKYHGLPVCLSTIYWDQTEAWWADQATKKAFSAGADQAGLNTSLSKIREGTFEVPGLAPGVPSDHYRAMRSAQRRLFHLVDMLLPNSELEMREISVRLGVCNRGYQVIPNGVNADIFRNASPDEFIAKYGMRDFVIIAGRLEGAKNQLLCLHALKDLDIPVVVVGSQADKAYTELCRKHAGKNVVFIDHLPQRELASAYAAAKVCLLGSWRETPGLAALEAALAGCSVVVTNRGATWEYFKDMAYYCDPSDTESVREAVTYAYYNYENDSEARERLKETILSQYNWRKAAETTLEAYASVMADAGTGATERADESAPDFPRRPRVSIIIPVFNKAEYTAKCLVALEKNTPKSLKYEVVVVDNASTDSTQALLSEISGSITVIRNERNMGFARACNQGAAAARGDYLLFLNNDTEPQEGWLEPLVKAAKRDGTGAVGSLLLFPDRTIQHAGVVFVNTGVKAAAVSPYHIYYHMLGEFRPAHRPRDLQVVTGACLLVPKPVFDAVSGFNEVFWNGYEDVDLCLRIGALGFAVAYEPKSVLIHHESVSGPERFSKSGDNVVLLDCYWTGKVVNDDQDVYLQDGLIARFVMQGNQWRRDIGPVPGISLVMRCGSDKSLLRASIESLVERTTLPIDVTLVGNLVGSLVGKADLAGLLPSPGGNSHITVRTRPEVKSLGEAADQKAEYVVFCDAPPIVTEGWLEGLLKGLEWHPSIGAAEPWAGAVRGDANEITLQVQRAAGQLRKENKGRYQVKQRPEAFCVAVKKSVLQSASAEASELRAGETFADAVARVLQKSGAMTAQAMESCVFRG